MAQWINPLLPTQQQQDAANQTATASVSQGVTQDQIDAVEKAQSQPGGIPTGYYTVNADGTLTLTKQYGYGQPGDKVAANGAYLQPDGTPRLGPDGQPGFAVRTPGGQPATDNPNFRNGDAVGNLLTKNNPIAGTIHAGIDLGQGKFKQAASDFGAGTSFGTLPQYDPNTGKIIPGDTTKDAASAAGVPSGIPGVTGDLSLPGLPGFGGGTSAIDTSAADAETKRANDLADALGVERGGVNQQTATDRGYGTQTREQQEAAIQQLQDAAAGKTPSVAELALTRQSGIDAARQYGLAAALQGNNPAAALRQASVGAAKVAGDTAANATQLRATEMANNRTALAQTLSGVRASDQGAVNTDVTQGGQLLSGQTTSQGQGVTSTGQKLSAEAAKAQADAQKEGAELGAVGALGAGLLTKSDRRAKKDVARAGLADALAKGVHGVEFSYVEPENDREEGRHFGALAQDLEDVIPGVVKKRGDGTRLVDTGHLSLANTATLAELARRLTAVEGRKGKRR